MQLNQTTYLGLNPFLNFLLGPSPRSFWRSFVGRSQVCTSAFPHSQYYWCSFLAANSIFFPFFCGLGLLSNKENCCFIAFLDGSLGLFSNEPNNHTEVVLCLKPNRQLNTTCLLICLKPRPDLIRGVFWTC